MNRKIDRHDDDDDADAERPRFVPSVSKSSQPSAKSNMAIDPPGPWSDGRWSESPSVRATETRPSDYGRNQISFTTMRDPSISMTCTRPPGET